MVILVKILFGSIYFLFLIFYKCYTSASDVIISILIKLDCLLSNFFNSFNKTIMVSIRVIINDSHSSINLDNLFPMRHFSRAIQLNSFEFVRIPIFSL